MSGTIYRFRQIATFPRVNAFPDVPTQSALVIITRFPRIPQELTGMDPRQVESFLHMSLVFRGEQIELTRLERTLVSAELFITLQAMGCKMIVLEQA